MKLNRQCQAFQPNLASQRADLTVEDTLQASQGCICSMQDMQNHFISALAYATVTC